MRFLKRLVFVVLLVLVGMTALWIYQGPFYALREIAIGLDARDPIRVERYADLEKIVASSATVLAEIAKEEAGVAGSDPGGALLGALVGVIAGEVGKALSPEAAAEMRRAIQAGTLERGIGPFEVHRGLNAFGDFEMFDQHATVTLRGTCKGSKGSTADDARLKVVLERRDAGLPFGLLSKHVLVGVDKDSARDLARSCRS